MPVTPIKPAPDKAVLTAAEACGYLGVCWNTMKKLLNSGEVRAKRVGARYIFTRAFLEDYLNADRDRAMAILRSMNSR
ncbi:MAG: helix-turn-helix domain-containing protein [Nitrospirae bacterium]|nr:helix-turn-helix domain-containing protein [Nitrospirota bacterium]